jgi:hypothetical protein
MGLLLKVTDQNRPEWRSPTRCNVVKVGFAKKVPNHECQCL